MNKELGKYIFEQDWDINTSQIVIIYIKKLNYYEYRKYIGIRIHRGHFKCN